LEPGYDEFLINPSIDISWNLSSQHMNVTFYTWYRTRVGKNFYLVAFKQIIQKISRLATSSHEFRASFSQVERQVKEKCMKISERNKHDFNNHQVKQLHSTYIVSFFANNSQEDINWKIWRCRGRTCFLLGADN
jgi:hypothetical protein